MGLYKGQNIITGSYMLPRADDNRQVNVSRKRIHKKREEQEKKEDEGREENKEAGSTKNIYQRSTSLPHF
jgi:post-segregation antitoxin (ccd killing protein)